MAAGTFVEFIGIRSMKPAQHHHREYKEMVEVSTSTTLRLRPVEAWPAPGSLWTPFLSLIHGQ